MKVDCRLAVFLASISIVAIAFTRVTLAAEPDDCANAARTTVSNLLESPARFSGKAFRLDGFIIGGRAPQFHSVASDPGLLLTLSHLGLSVNCYVNPLSPTISCSISSPVPAPPGKPCWN